MQEVKEWQLEKLYETLKKGVPLYVALTNAHIRRSTYFYWLSLASVVHNAEETEDLWAIKKYVSDEEDIEYVKDVLTNSELMPTEIMTRFIQSKPKTIRKYHNDPSFREFCNKAFEIIMSIDSARSEAIVFHINKVAANGQKIGKNKIDAKASMWYLERVLPSIFARKEEVIDENKPLLVEKKPIEVVYVNPTENDSLKRIEDMTNEILNVSKGEDA